MSSIFEKRFHSPSFRSKKRPYLHPLSLPQLPFSPSPSRPTSTVNSAATSPRMTYAEVVQGRSPAATPLTKTPASRSPPFAAISTPKVAHEMTTPVSPLSPVSSERADLEAFKVRFKNALGTFPDFPSPGIIFKDIMPIFADPKLHGDLIDALTSHCRSTFPNTGSSRPIDAVVGLESRGFLFGPSLALKLGAAFVPVRKRGKLPGPCISESYQKEYGTDIFEMQEGAIKPGWRVIVVDDLIATGGSASAAGKLVKQLGGNLLEYIFLVELLGLGGKDLLDAPVFSLVHQEL